MSDLTDADIETGLRLDAARTPGEWGDIIHHDGDPSNQHYAQAGENYFPPVYCYGDRAPQNIAFCCHAGEHYADALREVRRLREENTELKAMKLAYQETPKQWSTAQAPTLEAILHTARGHEAIARAEKAEALAARLAAALEEARAWMGYEGGSPAEDAAYEAACEEIDAALADARA